MELPQAPAHRRLLILSAVLGVAMAILINEHPYGRDSFFIGANLGVFVVCLIPWLAFLRQSLSRYRSKPSLRSDFITKAFLFAAIVTGPAATVLYWLWTKTTSPVDGWARLEEGIGFVVVAAGAFGLSYIFGILALIVQLWRDRWAPILTTTATLVLLGAYLLLVHINT